MADRIVFLDVDGVLNSYHHVEDSLHLRGMAHAHVEQLARILRETKAKVVVSSTWRKWGLEAGARFHDELQNRHGAEGELILSRTIGRTVDGYADGLPRDAERRVLRGTEIQHWLDTHEPVESFVILDDDQDMGPLMHRLVRTSMANGLTPELADEAIRKLMSTTAALTKWRERCAAVLKSRSLSRTMQDAIGDALAVTKECADSDAAECSLAAAIDRRREYGPGTIGSTVRRGLEFAHGWLREEVARV
jgi:hypothetical protein